MNKSLAIVGALVSVCALPSAAFALDAFGQFYNVSLPSNIGLRTDISDSKYGYYACGGSGGSGGENIHKLSAFSSSGAELARFELVGNYTAGAHIKRSDGTYTYVGFGQVNPQSYGVPPTLEINIDSNGQIACVLWKGYSNGVRQGQITSRYTSVSNRIAQGNVTTLSTAISATNRSGETSHPTYSNVDYLSTGSVWTDWPSASTYPNSYSVYYSNDGCGNSGYIFGQTSGTVGGGSSGKAYTYTTFF